MAEAYDKVIALARKRLSLISRRTTLLQEIEDINFKLETYSDTFSDADEYANSYTLLQEDLEDRKIEVEYLNEEIKKIENTHF